AGPRRPIFFPHGGACGRGCSCAIGRGFSLERRRGPPLSPPMPPTPPLPPVFAPHDIHAAADPQAREARRKRLILAVVAGAVLVAVIAWAMKPGTQSASGPGGRGADAGRPIPVRAVAASTGSVDVTVDALGT